MKKTDFLLFFIVFSVCFPFNLNATVYPGWVKHVIGSQVNGVYVYVKDIDGDGDFDVATTTNKHPGLEPSEIAWWRNNIREGLPWDKIIIRSRTDLDTIEAALGIVIEDIDNDGKEDIAVASGDIGGLQGTVCWFKSPADPTEPGTSWIKYEIDSTSSNNYAKIYTFDSDNDDDKDIIVSGTEGAVLFLNPGSSQAAWEKVPLPTNPGTGVGLYLDDWNLDGSTDIINVFQLIAGNISLFDVSNNNGEIVLQRTMVDTSVNSPFDPCSMDIDGEGFHDLIVSALDKSGQTDDNGRLYWYKAPATEGGPWTQNLITNRLKAADVYPGDIDGDGRMDFITSALFNDKISWFRNLLVNGKTVWSQYVVDNSIRLPGDISLNDIDGDGDLDAVTTAVYGDEVVWYENTLEDSSMICPSDMTFSVKCTSVPGMASQTISTYVTLPDSDCDGVAETGCPTDYVCKNLDCNDNCPEIFNSDQIDSDGNGLGDTCETPPTLISLGFFTATAKAWSVVLKWATESEIDNVGFNLYRAESENGAYSKINNGLIPAAGSPTQGSSYQFLDENVQNRNTYYYKLEDIDMSGKSTMHGPVSAMPRLLYGLFQ